MEDIKTLSDLLEITDYYCYSKFENIINELIIDKDYYILSYLNLYLLNKVDFDFNSINFDIKLNNISEYERLIEMFINNDILKEKLYNYDKFEDIKINNLYEYVNLLNIFENNEHMKYELINIYDINNLKINNVNIYDININIVKILNYKNFNFELLKLEDVLKFNIDIIRYLIDNNLYNFLNKNELNILINCDISTFEFFINYLSFDVYKLYDNKNLCYYICNYNCLYNFLIKQKLEILYKKYNLIIDNNELILFNTIYIYKIIFQIYNLEDIINYDNIILNKLLISNFDKNFYNYDNINKNKYLKIFDKINDININLLIELISIKYYSSYNEKLFAKIIDKLKINYIINLLNTQCDLLQIFSFIYLYFTYYDKNINIYINNIFNCNNLEDFNNLIKDLKYDKNSNSGKGIELIKKYYEN